MAPFNMADLTTEERKKLYLIQQKKKTLIGEIQQLQDELQDVNTQIESMNVSGENGTDRVKTLLQAQEAFNQDPKKGLSLIFESGLLPETPIDVAKFLFNCDGLKKTAIGDYLGENNDFSKMVLKEFVDNHDFRGLTLVQALRNFLHHFRLPGEAQKIDRIMERFAARYCEQNPGIFQHPDHCYTLSYAVIMLNTSLHNPSVKQRMSLEDFIKMTAPINVPNKLVTEVYNAIKLEAFRIPEDPGGSTTSALHPNADKFGWLWKQGSRYRNWSRRWFVLVDKFLYYFENQSDKEPKGVIPLENVRVRVCPNPTDSRSRTHCFEIYSRNATTIKMRKPSADGKLIEGEHPFYKISTPNQEELFAWISAIQRSVNKNSQLELLQWRRKRLGAGCQSDPTLNFRSQSIT